LRAARCCVATTEGARGAGLCVPSVCGSLRVPQPFLRLAGLRVSSERASQPASQLWSGRRRQSCLASRSVQVKPMMLHIHQHTIAHRRPHTHSHAHAQSEKHLKLARRRRCCCWRRRRRRRHHLYCRRRRCCNFLVLLPQQARARTPVGHFHLLAPPSRRNIYCSASQWGTS